MKDFIKIFLIKGKKMNTTRNQFYKKPLKVKKNICFRNKHVSKLLWLGFQN